MERVTTYTVKTGADGIITLTINGLDYTMTGSTARALGQKVVDAGDAVGEKG
jgi:hypothetical protein